jgi:Xaa-Pro aminopeptidase
MEFEMVTVAPIDRDAILPELLTQEEREWLNQYHQRVYEVLSPDLTEEENKWLKEITAVI